MRPFRQTPGASPGTRSIVPLLALMLAASGLAHAGPVPVFVEAAENGQGLLRERNGECFVVTPKHVVEGSDAITIVASGRLEAGARLDATFAEDVAVLRVVDRGRFGCAFPWDEAAGLDELLRDSPEGVLVSTSPTGALQRRFVRIAGFSRGAVRIRPVTEDDAFFKTLSGGLLEIRGRPAGILLRADAGSGEGTVMRMDQLTDVVRRFFDVRPADAFGAADGYSLRPLSFRAMASERAHVHAQPDRLAPTLATLDVGTTFNVTGQVNERLWFRIERNGLVGFIPTTAAKRL